MSIERRKSKNGITKYRVRLNHKGRAIKSSTFTKIIDAKKWEAEQKVSLERNRNFPYQTTKMFFRDLYNLWLTNFAEIKKSSSSVKKDKQVYKNYIEPFIGSMDASSITPADINNIVRSLKSKTELTNNSINKVMQIIKALFNYGVRQQYILYNPANPVESLPVEPSDFSYWTKEETEKFLKHCNNKYKKNRTPYLIYLTALLTGMRAGEIFALKWDCIDLPGKLITIKRSTDRFNKSIKETTKSNKIRYVGINEILLSEFNKLKKRSKKVEFVFENSNGDLMDFYNFRNRFFVRDTQEAEVRTIRFHDLRHTFASHYMMNKGNIYYLQKILGHSDVKVTMRYAHLEPDNIAHTSNIVTFNTGK